MSSGAEVCFRLTWPQVSITQRYGLYPIEQSQSLPASLNTVADQLPKIAIERRRDLAKISFHGFSPYQPPHTRREADLVRLRIQHWMELADAALRSQKPHGNGKH
jgi:hypothetical protein